MYNFLCIILVAVVTFLLLRVMSDWVWCQCFELDVMRGQLLQLMFINSSPPSAAYMHL